MIFSPGRQPDRIFVPALNRGKLGLVGVAVGAGTGGDVDVSGLLPEEIEEETATSRVGASE